MNLWNQAGDALFFHCNLLHRSNQNKSPHPHWSFVCCYNAARNNPYKESHHPRYEPLLKVDDAELKKAGARLFSTDTRFWKAEDSIKTRAEIEI